MATARGKYQGFILGEREENRYHDSYWWLTVWNPYEDKPETFMYTTTAGGCELAPIGYGELEQCKAETLDSVKQRFELFQQRVRRRAMALVALDDIRKPHKGALVRVARGRKVPKGTIGRVLSTRERVAHVSQYGTWTKYQTMCHIITEQGSSWTVDASNCDILEESAELRQTVFDLCEVA